MSGAPWRVAVAGLGAAWRDIHRPALRGLGRVRLVAVCDPDADARAAFDAEDHGCPTFACAQAMLNQVEVDLLAVVTPPSSHPELVRLGLERGCHVFCEKPLADDLENARELVALAEKHGRRLIVNQEFRYMRMHQAALRMIGTPELGDLIFLEARQTFFTTAQTEAGWRGRDPRRTCKEFGIHVLDLCRMFFGSEPIALEARMPRPLGDENPELLDLIRLEWPGGRCAQIVLDRLSRGRHRYLRMRLDGRHGVVETRLGGRLALAAGLRGGPERGLFLEIEKGLGGEAWLENGETRRSLATDPLDLFAAATRRLLEDALDALDADREPPCSGRDHLRSLALVFAAYESDERRGPVYFWGADDASI